MNLKLTGWFMSPCIDNTYRLILNFCKLYFNFHFNFVKLNLSSISISNSFSIIQKLLFK